MIEEKHTHTQNQESMVERTVECWFLAGTWKFEIRYCHLRMTISNKSFRKPYHHTTFQEFCWQFGSLHKDHIHVRTELPREFRVLLRKWHPDKNPDQQEVRFGNFGATETSQKVRNIFFFSFPPVFSFKVFCHFQHSQV